MVSHTVLQLFKVKVNIAHHKVKVSDSTITPAKDLVFILDDPADEQPAKKRKKKKAVETPAATVKNFGNKLSIPKVKNSSKITIAWRCRLDAEADGVKMLMPVRPVAILSGAIELEKQNLSLM